MQDHDWDDLKYLLAVHRTGRLSAAALQTATNETTVARRIRRLETALGGPLLQRDPSGRFELTALGMDLLPLAEDTERAQQAIRDAAGQSRDSRAGTLRLTSVPIIVNRILLPRMAELGVSHPSLQVDLLPEARTLDLTRHEADLALRFARPETGGHALRARRLGALRFAAFAPAHVPDPQDLGWIGYEIPSIALPQAEWTRTRDSIAFVVSDAETALESVAHGLGRALLPVRAAQGDPRLRPLPGPAPIPDREVWMVWRAADDDRPALVQARDWLATLGWD